MKTSLFSFVSIAGTAAVLSLGTLGAAQAASITTTIDFESGFSDLQPVDTVLAGGNQVTFSVGPGTTGGISPAFIAETGGPITAFSPNDGAGTAIAADIGSFFLTDRGASNYFIEFDQAVSGLGVDILDFRGDGGTRGGDVTLTAFSDLFSTAISSTTFTIVNGLPDANLESLFVDVPGNLIQSASIVYSGRDIGTGIDNITFETEIPEPSSVLGLLALATLGASSRLVRKQKQQ